MIFIWLPFLSEYINTVLSTLFDCIGIYGKTSGLVYSWPDQIDHQKPALSAC